MTLPKVYQLPLLEESPIQSSVQEVVYDVNWSYSRRTTLERCSRQYYYIYYGANLRTAKQEPEKETLRFLKNRVTNRYFLSGDLLHRMIKIYFDHAREGNVWQANRLVSFAEKIFEESWAYSRAYPEIELWPDEPYPPKLLQEYYSGDPEAETLCTSERTRLVNALRSFITNDVYKQFRTAGSISSSLAEHSLKLRHFPCRVAGRIDLAYWKNNRIHIVDWKLGTAYGTGDNSLQLAVYAMWAVDSFGCTADDVQVCEVHLSSNEIVDFRADVWALASARARIIQDAERMVALEKYGKNAIVEAFTPCGRPRVCNNCVFRRVCDA